jgi:hypothetical protein
MRERRAAGTRDDYRATTSRGRAPRRGRFVRVPQGPRRTTCNRQGTCRDEAAQRPFAQ